MTWGLWNILSSADAGRPSPYVSIECVSAKCYNERQCWKANGEGGLRRSLFYFVCTYFFLMDE